MNVLFLGASHTWGAGVEQYRDSFAALVSDYLTRRFLRVTVHNLSIAGTGTRLCAFMIRNFVKRTKPDLVFLEYSINDTPAAQHCQLGVLQDLEYVIRTILEICPRAFCLVLHFARRDFTTCVEVYDKIVGHYGVSALDLQHEMKCLTDHGALWPFYFAEDGVHPNRQGHAFYAQKICDFLAAFPDPYFLKRKAVKLPGPYSPEFYRNPTMVPAETFLQSEFWTPVPYHDVKRSDAVLVTHYIRCHTPEVAAEFTFSGHSFGLYHLVRKDGGKLRISVDGEGYILDCYYPCDGDFVNFFNIRELPDGIHCVKLTLLGESNSKSNGCQVGIAGFLLD